MELPTESRKFTAWLAENRNFKTRASGYDTVFRADNATQYAPPFF
jgi:hypothetical protein